MERIIVAALVTLLAALSAEANPERSPALRNPAASVPTTSSAEWTVMRNYERFLREPRMQFQPSRHA